MDPITHTLTGVALAEAGLKRHTRLALPALVIGANLPDVDVVAYLAGGAEALAFRRGWTHGALAMAVLPFLLAGSLLAWESLARRGRRPGERPPVRTGPLLLVSAAAVWSHPVLDWLNVYGVRLLMPLSDRWFYGDALFIADPWAWLLLGGGAWAARRRGPRWAVGALSVAGTYAALMWTGSAVGRSLAREAAGPGVAAGAGLEPLRSVVAAPVPIHPQRRLLVLETESAYRYGALQLLPRPEVRLDGPFIPKREELAGFAARDPAGRAFLRWSRLPYFRPEPGGIRVRDARYPGGRGAWASVTVPTPVRDDPATPEVEGS